MQTYDFIILFEEIGLPLLYQIISSLSTVFSGFHSISNICILVQSKWTSPSCQKWIFLLKKRPTFGSIIHRKMKGTWWKAYFRWPPFIALRNIGWKYAKSSGFFIDNYNTTEQGKERGRKEREIGRIIRMFETLEKRGRQHNERGKDILIIFACPCEIFQGRKI